jgi:acid phosphatase
VTWTVDTIPGGSATVGTIIGTGDTVIYSPPGTTGSHTVTATSVADTTKSANAAVTVTAPLTVTVAVTPNAPSVAPNATQQFTATVQNTTNTGVTWTVDTISGGDATVGTITGTGNTVTYTAPATTGTHTITATSVADTTQSGNAVVTVTTVPPPFPSSNHVFLLVEENQSFPRVFPSGTATNCASSGMPYLCGLAAANGLALNVYANSHGSLEDYLYMTSGSTWTASPTNCTGSYCASIGVITGDNIAKALTNAGKTWRGYFESMPSQGYIGGDSGQYFVRHNPFPWYSYVVNSVTEEDNMYPFTTQFPLDVTNNTFQNFSFIVPNHLDDADDPATGVTPAALLLKADTWLQTNISPLLSTPPFQPGGDGVLIVVFDEGDVAGESGNTVSDLACSPTTSGCGGHVALVMIGPNVKPASTTSNTYHFQDVLHTIIHLLGMTDYMGGSATASDIALLPGVP